MFLSRLLLEVISDQLYSFKNVAKFIDAFWQNAAYNLDQIPKLR